MDLLDSLALWGRRYEQQVVPGRGDKRFGLGDVLELFDRNAILELTPVVSGRVQPTVRPDAVRKVKVSLLDDGISAIHSGAEDWYEVFRTPPTGDVSKVRIVAHSPTGAVIGEVRMVVGRRSYEHYFSEDPIFEHLKRRAGAR
jgi:hypothetical protein